MDQAISSRKRFPGADSNILLRMVYESVYGIRNHFDNVNSHPFSGVLYSEKEENLYETKTADLIRDYAKSNIHEIFHINLLEFVSLPLHICQLLFRIAAEEKNMPNLPSS